MQRTMRGPLRPSWDDTYETLAMVLHHYGTRSTALPLRMQRQAVERFFVGSAVLAETRIERSRVGDVPAAWFRAPGADPERVLLYLHGGGYSIGSIDSHRDLVARLCRAAGCTGLSLGYRLAPEHPFPAQLDDAVAGYRGLLAEGFPAERVVVGGESAGGGLTLSLLVKLRDEGLPLPAGAFGISPWVDLEALGTSMLENEPFDYLNRKVLQVYARRFVRDGDRRNPLAAPLYAELDGLPPLLIHAGGAEVLLDDARRITERARQAGVTVDLEVWPDMIHAWHAYAPIVAQGRDAIARIGQFVRNRQGA
jgi:monoterpene epsilon-lactone hydrolase